MDVVPQRLLRQVEHPRGPIQHARSQLEPSARQARESARAKARVRRFRQLGAQERTTTTRTRTRTRGHKCLNIINRKHNRIDQSDIFLKLKLNSLLFLLFRFNFIYIYRLLFKTSLNR